MAVEEGSNVCQSAGETGMGQGQLN